MFDSQKNGPMNRGYVGGRVILTLRKARTSELVQRMESTNTIVGDGLEALLYLITQNTTEPAPANFAISSLRLGTGTTPSTQADKSLESEVYAVNFGTSEKLVVPASREVIFTHVLGSSEGNGYRYSEAGLAMRDASLPTFSKLFARFVHPPYDKISGVEATYEWHIGISTD